MSSSLAKTNSAILKIIQTDISDISTHLGKQNSRLLKHDVKFSAMEQAEKDRSIVTGTLLNKLVLPVVTALIIATIVGTAAVLFTIKLNT